MSSDSISLGVIGGSGLYAMPGLTDVQEIAVRTPFGDPSDAVIVGTLNERRVAFLPRHGRSHRRNPSEVNYRANIYALKSLGVKHVVSVSACGSLRFEMKPRDIVVPNQLFDFTKGRRAASFYDDGIVGHASVGEPFEHSLRRVVVDAVPALPHETAGAMRFAVMTARDRITPAVRERLALLAGAYL
jgi:5'-methylthioadenosine phosphorylase